MIRATLSFLSFHRLAALALGLLLLTGHATAQDLIEATTPPVPSADPVIIELHNGSRLHGTVVHEDENGVVLQTENLGELAVPLEAIAAREELIIEIEAELVEEALDPPGLLGTPLLAGWDRNIALGLSGKEGDISEFGINTSLTGDYEDDVIRWRLRAAYFYGTTEGVRTKDEGYLNLRRDWKLQESPLFLWAEGRGDYNDFQAWEARLGGFIGLGVSLFNGKNALRPSETLQLLTRLGAGTSYEFGTVNETTPEALAAIEGRWRVSDDQTLRVVHTYFPDLEDLSESRNVTEASYEIQLQQGRGLSVKLGVFNEYLSETEDDSSHNSLTYFAQLVYGF